MAESLVQVTEGVGKKLHTYNRVISSNTVEDEFVIPGEYPYLSGVASAIGVSVATSADHVMQVMAGAGNHVRIRRIRVEQTALATAAAFLVLQLFRLTSAGSGGTAVTVKGHDTADSPLWTAQTIPTVKGTEAATALSNRSMTLIQTQPVGGLSQTPFIEWIPGINCKSIIIPAGTANGLAIKVNTGRAAATVLVEVEAVETPYL